MKKENGNVKVVKQSCHSLEYLYWMMAPGFTLIELLVVVLIIGVLTAVAVPQYQKAVLKSRFSALMPLGKSIAESNEMYFLERGFYADDLQELSIQGKNNYETGTELELVSDGDYSYVFVGQGASSPNNYIVYQKYSPKFAGNIHCEADENNTQAQAVCTLFGGQEIAGSQSEGYKTYILSGVQTAADKLPSSLAKLAASLCAGNVNCTATINGNEVITQECTGDENANTGKTCINKTYDETGTQVDYEKTIKSCSQTGGNAYREFSCNQSIYDAKGKFVAQEYSSCQLYWAHWENNQCIPNGQSSSSNYQTITSYDKDRKLVESVSDFCLSFADGQCSALGRYTYNGSRQLVSSIQCEWPACSRVDQAQSKWFGYNAAGTRTEETFVSYNNNEATFTTKNIQTGEIIHTDTCSITNANWKTGTCEE